MRSDFLLFLIFWFFGLCAQGQSISIGGAGIYGDDIEGMGLHLRGYYNLPNNKVCLGPEFSHFFKQTERLNGEKITKKLSEFNFNVHYIFEISEKWGIYPLTGVNLSYETEEMVQAGDKEVDEITKWGANLGLGVHRPIGSWVIFGEFDHLFSDLSQNSLVLGAFITIGNKSKHGENLE